VGASIRTLILIAATVFLFGCGSQQNVESANIPKTEWKVEQSEINAASAPPAAGPKVPVEGAGADGTLPEDRMPAN
jgi:hypothetical protein